MKKRIIVIIVVLVALGACLWLCGGATSDGNSIGQGEINSSAEKLDVYNDIIRVDTPATGNTVSSPLMISGIARGNWFFEATCPVVLADWDGRIIAESYAQVAHDVDWMTTDFVPFAAELRFESPYTSGDPDFMRNGTLIIQKDNPSGLPEYDDAVEIGVVF
jgi:hypothetical protein